MTETHLRHAYEIHYHDRIDYASVQSFTLEGKVDSKAPRQLKFGRLAIFLFQLVDAGFYIYPEAADQQGMRKVMAFSPEYRARVEKLR